ncbi:hypothetical protein [Lederbergia ruris]|uniref:hypothetical protein n=1 Tax=Lederbergia ruris TaxID=217495 RepID=UPI0039A1A5BF
MIKLYSKATTVRYCFADGLVLNTTRKKKVSITSLMAVRSTLDGFDMWHFPSEKHLIEINNDKKELLNEHYDIRNRFCVP